MIEGLAFATAHPSYTHSSTSLHIERQWTVSYFYKEAWEDRADVTDHQASRASSKRMI